MSERPSASEDASGAEEGVYREESGDAIVAIEGRSADDNLLLLQAVYDRDLTAIVRLVERGANVDHARTDGQTPLHVAARCRNDAIIQYLLEHGADVNSADRDGNTPLLAYVGGFRLVSLPIVKLFVEHGADLKRTNRLGHNSVFKLVEKDPSYEWEVLEYLVEHGANVNQAAKDGTTPLRHAADHDCFYAARWLAEHGADVHMAEKQGWSLLPWAAERGDIRFVQCLVERSVDVNKTSRVEQAKGGYTAQTCWRTPLNHAANNGHVKVVQYLVEHGADINNADSDGWTPLAGAVERGHKPVVRYLMEQGADVSKSQAVARFSLHRAAAGGYVELVQYLLENGEYVNALDRDGQTPLLCTSIRGYIDFDVVQCLVWHGADVNRTDKQGRSLLLLAASRGAMKVVQLLVHHGADVNQRDRDGNSSVLEAAAHGHTEIVRYLVNKGADTRATAIDGLTALQRAERDGFSEMRLLLLRQVQFDREGYRSVKQQYRSQNVLKRPWFITPFDIEVQGDTETRRNIGGDFLAKWLDTEVVIKLFVPGSQTSMSDEIDLWLKLLHPNVIMLYGACDYGHHFFACEHAKYGSIIDHVSRNSSACSPWLYLQEAALGLQYLHERNIVHRGLRGSNILIGSDGQAKLAGFALRGMYLEGLGLRDFNPLGEYIRWASPEYVKGERLTAASDVYSLGMCIIETITRKHPYPNHHTRFIRYSLLRNNPYLLCQLDGFDDNHWGLVSRMCHHSPSDRVSLPSVIFKLKEFVMASALEPESEPPQRVVSDAQMTSLWEEFTICMKECTDTLFQQLFIALEPVYAQVTQPTRPQLVRMQCYDLVDDIYSAASGNATKNRIHRLSCSRTQVANTTSFWRRLHTLRSVMNLTTAEEPSDTEEVKWEQQQKRQIDMFVSELSNTYLILNDLKDEEDRIGFLSFLRAEIDKQSANYSPGQLELMEKAYTDISQQSEVDLKPGGAPVWFIPWYELMINERSRLGKGGFASVYKAKWLDSDVVVKKIRMDPDAGDEERREIREAFAREVSIWFDLSHPHIARLFGACHVGTPFFVCEFASNGTLCEYLDNRKDEIWRKLAESARGIQYLHARDVVHGDLKCNNILIGRDGKAKVTDFGLSSKICQIDTTGDKVTGAIRWVAPECLGQNGLRPTKASDIYSLGMCIVEALKVIEGAKIPAPWGAVPDAAVRFHVSKGTLPKRPSSCTDVQWHLIEQMCKKDPAGRLKIVTVVEELDKLANGCRGSDDGGSSLTGDVTLNDLKGMIQTLLKRKSLSATSQVYQLLLERLEELLSSCNDVSELKSILRTAREYLDRLRDSPSSYMSYTENALRAYSLHRRLDNWMIAREEMLPAQPNCVLHDWQNKCYKLLGFTDNDSS